MHVNIISSSFGDRKQAQQSSCVDADTEMILETTCSNRNGRVTIRQLN